MVRYSFSMRLFHPLLHAGFDRRFRCHLFRSQEGSRAARADFAPKIVAEGDLLKFDQTTSGGHAGLGLGFIKLEWGLFEGGKRVAELHEEGLASAKQGPKRIPLRTPSPSRSTSPTVS